MMRRRFKCDKNISEYLEINVLMNECKVSVEQYVYIHMPRYNILAR